MAEWRKVAKAFAFAEGHITQKEVDILPAQILADNEVSESEMDFLLEIKTKASSSVKRLDDLIAECQAIIK